MGDSGDMFGAAPDSARGGNNKGVVSSIRPVAGRDGWCWVCVDGRRVGAITRRGLERLGLEVGSAWTPAVAAAFEDECAFAKAVRDAGRWLRSRERSVAWVRARLAEKGHAEAAIERAIEALQRDGLLDDARAAAGAADRMAGRGLAAGLIEFKLQRAGIAASDAGEAVREAVRGETALDRAERLVRSRLAVARSGRAAGDARLRARLFRLLARNGFDEETCAEALRRVLGDGGEE
ncbi:MAG: RecX family transcriptional regulator [Phycisphaeraceae bacterium]|nr:RecX family transcriptional regulator [Phycisphaeraceae bacterium]